MAVSSQRVQRFGICLNQPTIKQIFVSIYQGQIALKNSEIFEFRQVFLPQSETQELSELSLSYFLMQSNKLCFDTQKHSFICNNPDMLKALYPFSYGNDKHFIYYIVIFTLDGFCTSYEQGTQNKI